MLNRFVNVVVAASYVLCYVLMHHKYYSSLAKTLLTPHASHNPVILLTCVAHLQNLLFVTLFVFLVLGRNVPLLKASGILPRLIALCATVSGLAFIFLPAANHGVGIYVTAISLMSVGIFIATISMCYLGQSISIFPEARLLVTNGPYRLIRHPMYLGEVIALMGTAILYQFPASIFVFLAVCILICVRAINEERLLCAAFGNYEAYRVRTAMIFPGLRFP